MICHFCIVGTPCWPNVLAPSQLVDAKCRPYPCAAPFSPSPTPRSRGSSHYHVGSVSLVSHLRHLLKGRRADGPGLRRRPSELPAAALPPLHLPAAALPPLGTGAGRDPLLRVDLSPLCTFQTVLVGPNSMLTSKLSSQTESPSLHH